MIVLGFDTSTPSTVVGLRLSDGITRQARDDPREGEHPGHATRLLPLASGLLSDAGVSWRAITRIAVGVGPGTFTGLRIGVATANGLAQSLGVEHVGVSSLLALSHAARADTSDEAVGVLPVIDARRGEVFTAVYEGAVELIAPQALIPEGIAGVIDQAQVKTSARRWIAVGDGAMRYREQIEHQRVSVPDAGSPLHQIQAHAICLLGAHACSPDSPVVPDYRRRPDAEIALDGEASKLDGGFSSLPDEASVLDEFASTLAGEASTLGGGAS